MKRHMRWKLTRIAANLKACDLAERLGISAPLLSRIENGRVDPAPDLAARIEAELTAAQGAAGLRFEELTNVM